MDRLGLFVLLHSILHGFIFYLLCTYSNYDLLGRKPIPGVQKGEDDHSSLFTLYTEEWQPEHESLLSCEMENSYFSTFSSHQGMRLACSFHHCKEGYYFFHCFLLLYLLPLFAMPITAALDLTGWKYSTWMIRWGWCESSSDRRWRCCLVLERNFSGKTTCQKENHCGCEITISNQNGGSYA